MVGIKPKVNGRGDKVAHDWWEYSSKTNGPLKTLDVWLTDLVQPAYCSARSSCVVVSLLLGEVWPRWTLVKFTVSGRWSLWLLTTLCFSRVKRVELLLQ